MGFPWVSDMMRNLVRATAAAIAAVYAATSPAMAAEAYLCGTDNVVYVELDKLEEMKRTDPCIASYYGLKVAAPRPASPPAAPIAKHAKKDAPQRRAAVQLRPRIVADDASPAPIRVRKEPERAGPKPEVVAAPGTDYRNVHVINAASPEGKWLKLPR